LSSSNKSAYLVELSAAILHYYTQNVLSILTNRLYFFLMFIYIMFAQLAQVLDLGELVRRAIKYLVEGLMVAIAAYAIPKRSMNLDEVALIALTAAATFSILDTYLPSMAVSARSGAGFGMGANLVGFPRM
jgi:hypothetical protein